MTQTKTRQAQENSTASVLPKTMHAIAMTGFGGPEVLTSHELPVHSPNAHEVVIAVHTAGVGSWDAEIRAGWWPFERAARFPLVPGSDGSGTIAAVGSDVKGFNVGDAVYGFGWDNPKGGFYAEYVTLAAEHVALIPHGLDLEEAGGAAVIGLTALQGIDDALHLKKGERILIHGASGAVGSAAVQFAKARGAYVLATASGEDGVMLARELGAVQAIDGKRADVLEAVRDLSDGGFDAILATTGEGVSLLVETLKPHGRIAYPNGVEPAPKKQAGIKFTSYDAHAGKRDFERLNAAIETSGLKVPHRTFALTEAGKAQELAQNGHVLGKVVLRVKAV